jgi:hypothetical protein
MYCFELLGNIATVFSILKENILTFGFSCGIPKQIFGLTPRILNSCLGQTT